MAVEVHWMIDQATPISEQIAYFLLVGVPMGALGFLVAHFITAISPEKHTRSIDRTSMRLQKRILHGAMPFGRYREPWKSSYMHAMAWVFRGFTVLLLCLWGLRIALNMFEGNN